MGPIVPLEGFYAWIQNFFPLGWGVGVPTPCMNLGESSNRHRYLHILHSIHGFKLVFFFNLTGPDNPLSVFAVL